MRADDAEDPQCVPVLAALDMRPGDPQEDREGEGDIPHVAGGAERLPIRGQGARALAARKPDGAQGLSSVKAIGRVREVGELVLPARPYPLACRTLRRRCRWP